MDVVRVHKTWPSPAPPSGGEFAPRWHARGGGCGEERARAHTYSALMDEAPRNEVITLAAIITNPFENGNASISCASRLFFYPSLFSLVCRGASPAASCISVFNVIRLIYFKLPECVVWRVATDCWENGEERHRWTVASEWRRGVKRRCELEACAVGTGCLGWFLQVGSSRALPIGWRHPPNFNFTTKLIDRDVLIEGSDPHSISWRPNCNINPATTGSAVIT